MLIVSLMCLLGVGVGAAAGTTASVRPASFVATCAYDDLAVDETMVLFYHDDDATDDIPNSASLVASGFETPNAAYIGNAWLKDEHLVSVKMCLEESKTGGTCDNDGHAVSLQAMCC